MRKGEVDAEVTLPNSIYTTTIPTLAYCLRGSSTTIMRARGGRIEDAGAYMCIHLLNELRYQV